MSNNIAFIFSGQGSQKSGLGKEIKNSETVGSKVFFKAAEILGENKISNLMEFDDEELKKTVNAQPSLFLNSMAIVEILKEKNIIPKMCCGLSLGEYSALCCAGAFCLEDGIKIVSKRGEIMSKGASGKGTMTAVMKSNEETILKAIQIVKEKFPKDVLSICNYNCPGQIVVGGDVLAIETFEKEIIKLGVKRVIRLNVEGPFHTEILKPSSEEFTKELEKYKMVSPKINTYTNVDGKLYGERNIKELLIKQMHSAVYFENCIKDMIEEGIDTFIEIGAGKTLQGFVKKVSKKVKVFSVENLEDIKKLELELEKNN